MRRIGILLAFVSSAGILASVPAFADMECGSQDAGNRHYAVCWLADGDQRCYLCRDHYRSGGSLVGCRVVNCNDLPS